MDVTEKPEENGCEGSVGFGQKDNFVCGNLMLRWRILV